jgi:hypothetical protein
VGETLRSPALAVARALAASGIPGRLVLAGYGHRGALIERCFAFTFGQRCFLAFGRIRAGHVSRARRRTRRDALVISLAQR